MARKKAGLKSSAKGRAPAGRKRTRKPAVESVRRFEAKRGPMPRLVAEADLPAEPPAQDAAPIGQPMSDLFRRDRELIHRLIDRVKRL